jgi:ribosome-associated heat shock protein Hsp15
MAAADDGEPDEDKNAVPRSGAANPAPTGQRLDKWLWFARVAKSRTLAATLVTEGKVRINGERVEKPAHTVRAGDTITIVMRQRVRILKVLKFAAKRGAATVAAALFDDLSPPPPKPAERASASVAPREPGSGRPTKRERREMDRFRNSE